MAHTCQNLILHCTDFRLGRGVKEWLEKRGLLGDCDIVSVAGGVKSFLSPKNASDRDFILGQIEISANLHHIREIILLNHTDCGAYGGSSQFDSSEKERDFHISEMKKAKELILEKFPALKVKMALAKIGQEGKVAIEEVLC